MDDNELGLGRNGLGRDGEERRENYDPQPSGPNT
jgi:hypothetical protein